MPDTGSPLHEHLAGQSLPPGLDAVLTAIADTTRAIAANVARGALGVAADACGTTNASGETQQALDLVADACFRDGVGSCAEVAGMVSEELDAPWSGTAGGRYLVIYDPLDGSSNIAVNGTVGSIFSVLPAPEGRPVREEDYLQPGRAQLAAGFCVYGPSTVLVLTCGAGTQAYTLDPVSGQFLLTQAAVEVPAATREFAINASNQRFWQPPVQRYVAECLAGSEGPRGHDFNMRWVASMVADVYRILCRGGVFLYPRDRKDPAKPGKLRLMYEVNPMALVTEQAGGAATDGTNRILDLTPQAIHQRVAVVLGSREEVQRIRDYHAQA